MNLGVVETYEPEERRILFENPRLETIPTDNPAVGEIPIFLSRELMAEILEGAAQERAGGLLLGSYSISNGVEFLELEGFAAARTAGPAGLPFEAGEWEALLRGWVDRHPRALGLGWWMAAKGRLSLDAAKRAFHEAFFPLHWQIALLVDPEARIVRFHQRKKGLIEECGCFVVQPRRT